MDESEILKRKLKREIKAREEAEALLEQKAEEIHKARVRAERAEDALRDAIRSLDDGFLLFDAQDNLVLANRRFLELYPAASEIVKVGMSEHDLWRQLHEAGILPHPGEEFCPSYGPAGEIDNGPAGGATREEQLEDGRVIQILDHVTEGGQRISIHRDITALRRAEAHLHWRLAAIENAADGIAITDHHGHFAFMNRAFAQMLGYATPGQLIGRPWHGIYTDEEQNRVKREVDAKLDSSGSWRGVAEAMHVSGKLVHQELALTKLPGGGLLCVTRDISDRLSAEAEQQRLMRRLFEAERLEAVGQLSRVIAHDINNLLSAISAFNAALSDHLEPESKAADYSSKIMRAVEQAGEVIERLQASYKGRKIEKVDLDLADLARNTAALAQATMPRNVTLEADIADQPIMVHGEQAQLGQLVMNLLVNAREAVGEKGGRISISLRDSDEDRTHADWAHEAEVGELAMAHYAVLRVTDSGHGMSAEVIEKVFQPNFTTKQKATGHGLGLSAAGNVAQAHEGKVRLRSTPGSGTAAELLLPMRTTTLKPHARVLVVDDNPGAGESAAVLLESLGHKSSFLESAADAIDVITDDPDSWDAVLTDQQMPGLTGTELAERLRSVHPKMPVIIYTGMAGGLPNTMSIPANVVSVLKKPLTRKLLADALGDSEEI